MTDRKDNFILLTMNFTLLEFQGMYCAKLPNY